MAEEDKIIGFNDELKPGTAEDLEKQYKSFQERMQKGMTDEDAIKITKKLNDVKE